MAKQASIEPTASSWTSLVPIHREKSPHLPYCYFNQDADAPSHPFIFTYCRPAAP